MNIDFARARENMVEQQVRPWDVLDVRVLETLATLPREAFVDPALRELAYADTQLPIGHGEAMMKPVVEGRVLQALLPAAEDSVLEIGTGSGYLTACLARLAREVTSLERHADLAASARARLRAHGFANASVHAADVFAGSPDRLLQRPDDAVEVAEAAGQPRGAVDDRDLGLLHVLVGHSEDRPLGAAHRPPVGAPLEVAAQLGH